MKATPGLKAIPVVVMTGSLNREDEARARGMGVTDYCIKPSIADGMETTTMCLRHHLGILTLGDMKGHYLGPSDMSKTSVFHPCKEDQQIPPSVNERFFFYEFGPYPWKLWE